MEIFLPNILQYFVISIGCILGIYGVGRLFSYAFREWEGKDEISNLFLCYMYGSIIIVSIFALLWTRGNSIYLLCIPVTLLYLWWRRSDKIQVNKLNYKKEAIFLSVLFFLPYISSITICSLYIQMERFFGI